MSLTFLSSDETYNSPPSPSFLIAGVRGLLQVYQSLDLMSHPRNHVNEEFKGIRYVALRCRIGVLHL
ncbi:MAG: hypothetical protein QXV17_09035, partial [Candidatus Micrarchaeaceae archaeon]